MKPHIIHKFDSQKFEVVEKNGEIIITERQRQDSLEMQLRLDSNDLKSFPGNNSHPHAIAADIQALKAEGGEYSKMSDAKLTMALRVLKNGSKPVQSQEISDDQLKEMRSRSRVYASMSDSQLRQAARIENNGKRKPNH